MFVASAVDNHFIRQYDPELTFFKAVLKFKEEEIQYTHLKIFDSCGLDFFISPPNEQNQRLHENAIMGPSIQFKDNYIVTANNWIRNGNIHSTCYLIRQGF